MAAGVGSDGVDLVTYEKAFGAANAHTWRRLGLPY
jgi:hypothetical protein